MKDLDCLGIIYRHEKEYGKALEVVNESLSISRSIGDKHGERKYLNSIGLVKEQTADYKGALDIYLKCLKLSKNINEKRSIAVSYNNIACTYVDLNELNHLNKSELCYLLFLWEQSLISPLNYFLPSYFILFLLPYIG